MTAGRRAVGLTPMETRRDVIVAAALLADELGYETFAVPEGWGLDSTPVLAEIALRTSRIQVASAVLSVWGRTPATLAMTAATLHHMSAGRYVLGLGASTPALAEGFHDVPFVHPAGRLRDVLTAVRALLDGQPAELRRVPHARPLRLGQPPVPGLPIWIAALGPQATRVAAELGDGWIPALVARDRLPAWAARLRRTRDASAPDAPASPWRRVPSPPRRTTPPPPGTSQQLRRLVPDRDGRGLRPLGRRSGLSRRRRSCHRGQPATQPAARDYPARSRFRAGPASRLRDRCRGARAGRALGSRRRRRDDPAAPWNAVVRHRSNPQGRGPGQNATDSMRVAQAVCRAVPLGPTVVDVADRDVDDALARSFLVGLPAELTGRLLAEGERADYPAGTTVYRAGDDPQAALVVRGLIRVHLSSSAGRQVTVRYTRPGDVLGIAVLVGGPANTSVQTVEPSSVFRISARTLTTAARSDARVSWVIAEELNRRLYEVLEQTAVNAFGSVRQRVAAHLLDLASDRQRPRSRLVVRVSQQELADAAGSVREVVARVLRDLRGAGIVGTAADSVVILDPARLYAESGGPAGL